MDSIQNLKWTLREKYKKQREALYQLSWVQASLVQACDNFAEWYCQSPNKNLFLYYPTTNELPYLSPLIHALDQKRAKYQLALPRVEGGGLAFYSCTLPLLAENLRRNKWGIFEPPLDPAKIVSPDSRSVVLVPALSVDRSGQRLGYGGGYYDRYLNRWSESGLTSLVLTLSPFVSQIPLHVIHGIEEFILSLMRPVYFPARTIDI